MLLSLNSGKASILNLNSQQSFSYISSSASVYNYIDIRCWTSLRGNSCLRTHSTLIHFCETWFMSLLNWMALRSSRFRVWLLSSICLDRWCTWVHILLYEATLYFWSGEDEEWLRCSRLNSFIINTNSLIFQRHFFHPVTTKTYKVQLIGRNYCFFRG